MLALRGGFSVAGFAAAVRTLTAPQSSSGSRSHGSGRPQSPKDSDRLRLLLTVMPILLAAAPAVLMLPQRAASPLTLLNGDGAAAAYISVCCGGGGGDRRHAALGPLPMACNFSEDALRAMLERRAASMLPSLLLQTVARL